jgi:hypothetical protein
MGVVTASVPEPARDRGAVYTPVWLARQVVERTLGPLGPVALEASQGRGQRRGGGPWRIIDPACGDGIFLVCAWDWLRAAGVPAATLDGCVHGFDLDAGAVRAARRALVARGMTKAAARRNIRVADALGPCALARGRFDAVVGNPPYLEPKRIRRHLPATWRAVKRAGAFRTCAAGKTDLALPFIERALELLRPGGRVGLVVQSRFFTTDYGRAARRLLSEGRLIEAIDDFGDLPIFPGRTTYAVALTLAAGGGPRFTYRTFGDLAAARAGHSAASVTVETSALDDGPWSFGDPELTALERTLARRHGRLGEHSELSILVGIQTLYGRVYRLGAAGPAIEGLVQVETAGGQLLQLERAVLRPLLRNRAFRPLAPPQADAWVIFPYEITSGRARPIEWPEFRERFPRAAAYLEAARPMVEAAVQTERDPARWHLYTRPQNLFELQQPKLVFPMTTLDTVAAVDAAGELYTDNANIYSLITRDPGIELSALAALFCSSVFHALASAVCGRAAGGWRKLSRQFAARVPLPLAALRGPGGRDLAELARALEQPGEPAAAPELWARLDDTAERLYALDGAERRVLARHPRRRSRTERR